MSFTFIIGAMVAYLLGSIPSGLWVGQYFFKKDIRQFGSGNLGSTNAFRVLLAITRMVSLTAMVTITLGVFLSLLFNDWTLTLFALAINIFIIYRHRSNIQRILNGTENKVPMPWEQKNKDTK